jgi:hypothetical protein
MRLICKGRGVTAGLGVCAMDDPALERYIYGEMPTALADGVDGVEKLKVWAKSGSPDTRGYFARIV